MIIDIDRHMLSEIIKHNIRIKVLSKKFAVCWGKIIEVRDKTDALLFNSEPNDKSEKELMHLRGMIFTATKRINKIMAEMQDNFSQSNALMIHLVSEVRNADTGKGQETITKEV